MYANISPVEERALSGVGRDIIDSIAKSRCNLVRPRKDYVKAKFGRRTEHAFQSLQSLIIAGFVSESYDGSARRELDLTEKGWRLVGGKPFWMGA